MPKISLGQLAEKGLVTIGETPINSLSDIYCLLDEHGPFMAVYVNDEIEAHVVVVTGVDVEKNLVYTNNSMGFQGAQSYEEFMDAYYIGDLEGNDFAASLHKIVTRYVGYYYTLDKEW